MIKHLAAAIVLLFLGNNLHAQADLKKLDAYFAKAVKDWDVPGMAVGIVKDGKMVFAKGYGVREVGKPDKVDENSLFAIASISKAFTTTAMAMMVQDGKLRWNDPVRKHLPYFQLYDDYVSNNAMVIDLLSHRIGHRTFSGDAIWYLSDDLTAEDIIRRARYLEPSYPFRAGYGYSNIMYITAGEVMKTVDGRPWGPIIQSRIFDKIGMDRSVYSSKMLASKGNFITPHSTLDGKNLPIQWEDWEIIAPTGGVISSAVDMSKWMIFNLQHGVWKGDTLLTKDSRNILWSVQNPGRVDHTDKNQDTHLSGYGLGWNLQDYKGKLRATHGGGYSGVLSNITLIPDDNLGIIVFTNCMKGGILGAVVNYTLDAYNRSPERDWSAEMLSQSAKRQAADTRIEDRKNARQMGTKPSVPTDKLVGIYASDIYGNIEVRQEGSVLRMYFEHSKRFNATLEHWHYDVWKINFDRADQQSWFSFGTVQFDMDNNLAVKGMTFDVPNNDIWFEELKPRKVK